MSLVNDMLRDLDQRRKDSEPSSAPIKLTPANEIPSPPTKNRWLFTTIALVIVAAGLIYVWFDANSNRGQQTLNIRPEVAQNDRAIENNDTIPPPVIESEQQPQSELEEIEAPLTSEVVVENTESQVVESETRGEESPTVQYFEEAEAPTQIAEQALSESTQETDESLQNEIQQSEGLSEQVIVDVINVEPEEPVKDVAELSAEERDTIAVQDALQLIADNRVVDAYAHLEQHVLNNRYAHQSRETYAKLLMSQGELSAALALVDSGLELAPNHSGYKKVKARILVSVGQISEAVELLLTRAPEVAVDPEYHDLLATSQLLSSDFAGALVSYTTLVQHDQNEGKYWYGFAASQDSLGNTNAAAQAYSQAMQYANLSANLRRRSQERLSVLSQ
ncbi:MAG: tetratricopeptide repeat protein [Pseudomonadales bacterium]|nr:tetratricopeptide repeat protein [Pseudomonadales bacterium]